MAITPPVVRRLFSAFRGYTAVDVFADDVEQLDLASSDGLAVDVFAQSGVIRFTPCTATLTRYDVNEQEFNCAVEVAVAKKGHRIPTFAMLVNELTGKRLLVSDGGVFRGWRRHTEGYVSWAMQVLNPDREIVPDHGTVALVVADDTPRGDPAAWLIGDEGGVEALDTGATTEKLDGEREDQMATKKETSWEREDRIRKENREAKEKAETEALVASKATEVVLVKSIESAVQSAGNQPTVADSAWLTALASALTALRLPARDES